MLSLKVLQLFKVILGDIDTEIFFKKPKTSWTVIFSDAV